MKPVPLTVRLIPSLPGKEPKIVHEENAVKFRGEKFPVGPKMHVLSDSTIHGLISTSATIVLLADQYLSAGPSLKEILMFACSLGLASVSVASIAKNRSYVDMMSSDSTRKFLSKMPLNRILHKTKLNDEVGGQLLNTREKDTPCGDLPRLRSITVILIYLGANVLTIVDLAGLERFNSFCRLNDGFGSSRHGALLGFIFEVIPMTNPRYVLHLDQESDESDIRAILNIFRSSAKECSPEILSSSARSSGTHNTETPRSTGTPPGYARPTKSSIAPKMKSGLIYQVTKPKLTKIPTVSRSQHHASHVLKLTKVTMKKIEQDRAISKLKNRYHEIILGLKQDLNDLRSFSLLRNLSKAKKQLTALENKYTDKDCQHIQNPEEILEQVSSLSKEKQSLQVLLLKNEALLKTNTKEYETKETHFQNQIKECQREIFELRNQATEALSSRKSFEEELARCVKHYEHEKAALKSQNEQLSSVNQSLQFEVSQLKNQIEVRRSSQAELDDLKIQNKKLMSSIQEIKSTEHIQKESTRSFANELAEPRTAHQAKLQKIKDVLEFKKKVDELEKDNQQLRKELQESKANYQRDLTSGNGTHAHPTIDKGSEIFGYPDVGFGNPSSFSPITGFQQLSQIDFPSLLEKPILGLNSSPNRILRQSNVRLSGPPQGKLASSPIKRDFRGWEDIEN